MGKHDFCIDPFWDSNISWNNTWPQLTDCFQKSLLLPLPCFYLWLFLPFHLYSLCRRHPREPKVLAVFFILKMVCCLVMLTSGLAGIILDLKHYHDDFPASHVFASVVKVSSYILVTFTIVVEHKKGTFHSPGLLLYFVLLLVTHIVPFYSKIILQDYHVHTGSFAVFYIEYTAVLFSAVLHCFTRDIPDAKTSSPEEGASILSRLTLWWTTNLVIRGYKCPLTEDDIYPLNMSERASTIVPEFLRHLSKQVQCQNKQKRRFSSKVSHPKASYTKYHEVDKNQHPPLIRNGEPLIPSTKNSENGVTNFKDITVEFKDSSEARSGKGLGIFLWKVILHTFRKQLIKYCLIEMVVLTCTLSGPLVIKLLIEFMSNEDEQDWHGYLLAVVLFLCSAMGHLLYEFYVFQTNKFGMGVKTALFSAIYRKSLCLSSEAKQQCSSGEVIHLLSKDCDAIGTLCDEGFILIECPLELIVGLVMVYHTVGVAMFAGLATMGVFFLIKAVTTRKHAQYDKELKEYADQRMKIASQVFSGIKASVTGPAAVGVPCFIGSTKGKDDDPSKNCLKFLNEVLKLYAWEEAFKNRICAIRQKELAAIFKYDLLRFFITFAWTGAVFWMIFFTFLTHVLIDEKHHLTASTVFVTMAYFTYIRRSSNCLAAVTDFIISGVNSAQRVAKFLMLKEIEKDSASLQATLDTVSENTAISISNGSYAWSATSEPILKNINVEIPKGSLVAIVGMVGCGKSSLLSAILGEMVVHNGSIHKKGTIAYIPQEAWIQNESLRNNILFGSDYREEDYKRMINACALTADLSVLPSADETEIGEKGINLSGGQKQRVSLARAVYQSSDVYLLDDPLSAVDSHVGQHIFRHVIGREGLLKDKTRILVTHGIHWLPEVDTVLVMSNGHLTEQGSLDELMTHNGPFAQFLSQYLTVQQQQKEGDAVDTRSTHDDGGGYGDIGSNGSLNKELDIEITQKGILERLLSIESQKSDLVQMGDIEPLGSRRNIHLTEDLLETKLSKQLSVKDGEKDNEDESRKLIEEEELAKGRVDWSVYTTFIKSLGYVSMATLALLYLGFYCFDVTAGFWLTFWVDSPVLNSENVTADSPLREQENTYYLGIYSLWGVLGTLMIIIFSNLRAWRHIRACHIIHENLITSVLASPIQFFDTTPVGRLLSRFSKDISVVDTTLLLWMGIWIHAVFAIICAIIAIIINIPVFLAVAVPVVVLFYVIEAFCIGTGYSGGFMLRKQRKNRKKMKHQIVLVHRFSKDISVVDTTLLLWMEIWIHAVFAIICAIIAIVINIPAFLVAAVPVVVLFYVIEKFYLPTSCQLRRLERKWLAPIFSHASESFAGTSVIRALGEEDRFVRTAEEKIDFCQKIKFASFACERWLSIRLGLLSDLLVLCTGLLAVAYRNELSPGLTGLSLSLVLIITNEMQLQVRVASFMEMDIVSVERILQYSNLASEAPRYLHCPGYSACWPVAGDISFRNVCVRYRPGLDLVLKDVTFDIHDGEKVGVVGRTGAGKSSLMLSLFRLIEPSQGKIIIDGLDISKLGLYELRQKLTILPQDPVLFTGSLKSNFDPFEQFTDEDIWKSVEHCHLKAFIQTLPEGLDFPVGEGGDNLSIGQRQLVCLGRALLRKTKILVLDEATAAVDVETDELIQKTIRSEFKSCTVLTIAHRLNTIMDYDRILVLDQGRVVEFDPPSVLLENSNSLFHHMVSDSHVLHRSS